MEQQHYGNHKRYYTPHHFVFYPVALALIGFSIVYGIRHEEQRVLWFFLAILVSLVTWLSFMLRQHYGMTLQDRVVLLELRYRYFALTGERLESLEAQLSKGQLFALRFAPDEEFVPLLKRALAEKLSPDAIKQAIKNWQGDHMRV